MISIDDCKDRYLYKLSSRNLTFGVYNAEHKGFIGIREKFGATYLFTEYHWDTGKPFGTAKALEEIEELPKSIANTEDLGMTYGDDKRPVTFLDGKGYFTDVIPPEEVKDFKRGNVKTVVNTALYDWLMKQGEHNG